MKFAYEPFILRRFAENRIFLVNAKMPFEYFINCFLIEHPFFLVSVLDDGRLAITPNPVVMPVSLFQTGYWPIDLFPTEYEYVTIKNGTYPLVLTAHPVLRIDDWFRKFEKTVTYFAKETLAEFFAGPRELLPIEFEKPEKLPEKLAKTQTKTVGV
jgi:hypothetical protein